MSTVRICRCRGLLLPILLASAALAASGGAATDLRPGAEPPIFLDRTAEFGVDFVHFNGMSGELYFAEMMGSGGALFDYDADGDLDLFLVQGGMLGPGKTLEEALFPLRHPPPPTDRLYRNDQVRRADGSVAIRFTDVTARSGLRATGYGMGVATADFDNDGEVDLYLTNYGPNQLWRNRGDGTFEDVTEASRSDDNRWSVPAVPVDYDRDGWIDLLVGNYVFADYRNHKVCMTRAAVRTYCSPSIFEPSSDKLLHNRGDGTFEDVTAELGLDRAYGPALGAVAADFDGDGWLDLYVANDGQPNQLWINRRGQRFEDEALWSGGALNRDGRPEASMGVGAADFDGDGDEDLFLTHLTEETNTLYLNDGQGMFTDRTPASGLAGASFRLTGFGTAWLDYDNDSRLDLLVVNGAVKIIEDLHRQGDPYPLHQPNQLFRQLPEGRYVEVTDRAGNAFEVSEVSRGALVGDLDNDGDPDVVVTNNNGPARVLINQVGQAASWLGLRLLTGSGRDALGARVALLRAAQSPLWRRVHTAGSYASARDPRILIGLGESPEVERVRVYWLDGRIEEWVQPGSAAYATLRPGTPRRAE